MVWGAIIAEVDSMPFWQARPRIAGGRLGLAGLTVKTFFAGLLQAMRHKVGMQIFDIRVSRCSPLVWEVDPRLTR